MYVCKNDLHNESKKREREKNNQKQNRSMEKMCYLRIDTRCSIWRRIVSFSLLFFFFRFVVDVVTVVVYQRADKVPLFFTFLYALCMCALIRGASSMQQQYKEEKNHLTTKCMRCGTCCVWKCFENPKHQFSFGVRSAAHFVSNHSWKCSVPIAEDI